MNVQTLEYRYINVTKKLSPVFGQNTEKSQIIFSKILKWMSSFDHKEASVQDL